MTIHFIGIMLSAFFTAYAHSQPFTVSVHTASPSIQSEALLEQRGKLEHVFEAPSFQKKSDKPRIGPINQVKAIELVPWLEPSTGKILFHTFEETNSGQVYSVFPKPIDLNIVVSILQKSLQYNETQLNRIQITNEVKKSLNMVQGLLNWINDPVGALQKELLAPIEWIPLLLQGHPVTSLLGKKISKFTILQLQKWTIKQLLKDYKKSAILLEKFAPLNSVASLNPQESVSSLFRFEGKEMKSIRLQLLKAYFRQHHYLFSPPTKGSVVQ